MMTLIRSLVMTLIRSLVMTLFRSLVTKERIRVIIWEMLSKKVKF